MLGKSIGRLAAIGLLCAAPAVAQTSSFSTLPPSNQLSRAALDVLDRMRAATAPAAMNGDVPGQCAFYQKYNDDRLAETRRTFATRERHDVMNGVPVDVVDPAAGIPRANTGRVLINVHGGAFMWGAGSGALVEAIPIAATMGVRVVTVDYRLTPEHQYPAASKDVTAVCRALLERYPAANIGISGCSAGGVITAQATAWIRRQGLPRPDAIGTFCDTGAPYSGDSPYLAGLAGGRDFAVSAVTPAHRRLAAAGVPSELHLFDGLPYAFFVWPDMPKSTEAYRLIARFFDRYLGERSR